MSSLERKMSRQVDEAAGAVKWTEPVPAPEIFVDGYVSQTVNNGVAKFTFFSLSHDPTQPASKREGRINLRLTMSVPSLMGVYEALGQLIEQMRLAPPEPQ